MIRRCALLTFAAAGLALASPPAPSHGNTPSYAPANTARPAPSSPTQHAATGGHGATHAPGAVSAYDALMLLQSGNDRFASGQPSHPNTDSARRSETATNGQQPFAVVLACADSRVPVEQIFDRGVGDVFVIRVAGNICDTAEIATIEYGLEHLNAPLLVVMGHSGCGAVTAAASGGHVEGPLGELLAHITPAVENAKRVYPDLQGAAIVPDAIRFNVWQSVEDLLKNSKTSSQLASTGKVKIVGAVYNIESGRVQWMGEAPAQNAILAANNGKTQSLPSAVRKPVAAPAHTANAATPNSHH